MAKRKVNADRRMFIVIVEYFSGREAYAVFETREDARDYRREKRKLDSVFCATVHPANRGPSNIKTRAR